LSRTPAAGRSPATNEIVREGKAGGIARIRPSEIRNNRNWEGKRQEWSIAFVWMAESRWLPEQRGDRNVAFLASDEANYVSDSAYTVDGGRTAS
jgi:NAD(P)-dependent dehydrogenase (short-subunit alcohol dehydrogenase family)